MKSVSVIIPYYNAKITIIRTLESAINQNFTDYEIILVDDGSTDNSHTVVENYIASHKDISFLHYYQKNTGPSEARNFAASKASGEYLAFLDADDSWESAKLQVQVQIMKQINIGLLGSNINIVKSNGKVKRKYFVKNDLEYVSFYKLLFKHYFNTSSVLVKKSVFEKIGGFPVRQRYAEDTLLFSRITRKYESAVSRHFLVNVYKPLFGAAGLSANIRESSKYVIYNFKELRSENDANDKKISAFLYAAILLFAYLKYFRKIIISFVRVIE